MGGAFIRSIWRLAGVEGAFIKVKGFFKIILFLTRG